MSSNERCNDERYNDVEVYFGYACAENVGGDRQQLGAEGRKPAAWQDVSAHLPHHRSDHLHRDAGRSARHSRLLPDRVQQPAVVALAGRRHTRSRPVSCDGDCVFPAPRKATDRATESAAAPILRRVAADVRLVVFLLGRAVGEGVLPLCTSEQRRPSAEREVLFWAEHASDFHLSGEHCDLHAGADKPRCPLALEAERIHSVDRRQCLRRRPGHIGVPWNAARRVPRYQSLSSGPSHPCGDMH